MNWKWAIPVLRGRFLHLLMVVLLLLISAPRRVFGQSSAVTPAVVTGEIAELLADDVSEDRRFGGSIAISNDTIVVGAHRDSANGSLSGAAYVFVRNAGGADAWEQVAKLTASDAAQDAQFGYDVAISGDTVVVGAYGDDSYTGAAYVFERNAGGLDTWGQVQKLTSGGGAAGDFFGEFVDISGDLIVVGAPMTDSLAGAAYIFERNAGGLDTWGQVTELIPTTPADSDARFGWSVAISGGTAVVGAHYDGNSSGAAYVFARNQGGSNDNWGEVQKLTGQDTTAFDRFGYAVDISVDTVVVGARDHDSLGNESGAAYVFERNQDGADHWGQVQKLTAADTAAHDRFGDAVAVHGESIVVGTPYVVQGSAQTGAAYLFTRNQDGKDAWGQADVLAPGVALEDGAYFGAAVALNGHTLVVGAPNHAGIGAAYAFGRRGARWRQEQKTHGDDTVGGDLFGSAVAVSGDTLVAGAPYENRYGDYAGAAYVLARNVGGVDYWGEVNRLPIGSNAHDELGGAVDVQGDWLVVSAPGGDRAHICARNDGGTDAWSIVATVNGVANTSFGGSVALSGDTVVVGAPNESAQGHAGAGTAYIYVRNRGGADAWGFLTKLDAGALAEDNDHFGNAIALSGDTLVVGAYYADPYGHNAAGAAYVFERNFGGLDNWGMVGRLVADDADGGAWFGKSLAIANDTIIVGAPLETVDGYGDGAAYVFERNWGGCADIWGQVQKLIATDTDGGDYFGESVDLSFDVAVVGAYLDDSVGSDAGAAYVFERNAGGADNWGQVHRITAEEADSSDYFGEDVSISGGVIAVGGKYDDDAGNAAGSAYVYRWQAAHIYLPLVLRP